MLRPDKNSALADWLAWQESLHVQPIELGLGRVREVAARMGLPSAIPALTVAGTNGKGSCTTLLGDIYRAAGMRVGVYTSPHLLRYNERIVIDGQTASDAALCTAFTAIEQARADVSLTYFEFGTLAALWLFRESGVQLQMLEVGLGGRLDAVNLVDAEGMLITAIGLDHQDWLGADRELIAREKAGILRCGKPAVYVDAMPTAAVGHCAQEQGVPLQQLGRDFIFQTVADAWNWIGSDRSYKKLPMPGLAGVHQLRNAAGVLALVERLQPLWPVPESAIRTALSGLTLAGRFERQGRTFLDVAHNAEAVEVLCEQLRVLRLKDLILVLGMLADKPVEKMTQALAPFVAESLLAGLPGVRGLKAAELQKRSAASLPDSRCFGTVAEAYAEARILAGSDRQILVCGSFLTVAAVKQQLELLDG